MPITYISVFVVTVGSQENLGDFIHSAEEKRQLSLVGTEKKKGRKKSEAPRIFTNQSLQRLKQECVALCVCVCVLFHSTLVASSMNTNYLHLSLRISPSSQPSSPSEYPEM